MKVEAKDVAIDSSTIEAYRKQNADSIYVHKY